MFPNGGLEEDLEEEDADDGDEEDAFKIIMKYRD